MTGRGVIAVDDHDEKRDLGEDIARTEQPLNAEPRPVLTPLFGTVLLLVIVLVVFAVTILL